MAANMQTLNVRLSQMLEDTVGTYSTDGKVYTSVDRDTLLNRGGYWLFNKFYDVFVAQKSKPSAVTFGAESNRLRDFIKVKAVTINVGSVTYDEDGVATASGTDVLVSDIDSRFKEIISLVAYIRGKSILKDYKIVDQTLIPQVKVGDVSAISFTSDGSSVVCYKTVRSSSAVIRLRPEYNGSEPATPKATVSYLRTPVFNLASSDGSNDIEWSSTFWEDILQMALYYSLKSAGRNEEAELIKTEVMSNYGLTETSQLKRAL